MAKEIERKFIVNKIKWEKIAKPKGNLIRQGYILTNPEKTIRVRLKDDKGFLTIKGLSVGFTRSEFEYEIPQLDALELLNEFSTSELSKIRYEVNFKGKVWEVDEFQGKNEGLLIAEIEINTENEFFEIPDFIEREVTGEKKYYNSNLVLNPFINWS